MEIGDNAEKPSTTAANATTTAIVTSTIVHCTSQPTMPSSCSLDDEQSKDDENDGGAGGDRTEPGTSPQSHHMKKRRVSFAASTQLAQYLEPINPFQKLSEYNEVCIHSCSAVQVESQRRTFVICD